MGLEHLISFNIALLVAIASPGPALLVAIRTTLSAGRKAGIKLGVGLGFMAATWTLVALMGLEAIFTLFPVTYIAIKTLGALYLLYLALQIWRGAKKPITTGDSPKNNYFRQGILINLLNPKSVLFAAAVLAVIFPMDLTIIESTVIVFNHLVIEIAFYFLLAVSMSSRAVARAYLNAKTQLDRLASIVLAALGTSILAREQ